MQLASSKYWDCCCPVAGILLTLSFAPFNYAYLALIVLIFLFTSWQSVTPLRAAWRGYLFGLGQFGVGVSWVYISIHDFGGAHFIGSGLVTAFFVAFWALFPGLSGYLSVKLMPGNTSIQTLFVFPLVWILIEYFRGCLLLNGFPWLQIAYSQLETPLAGYIPLLGVYGTGFILAITAATVVVSYYHKSFVFLTCTFAVLWGLGSWLMTVQWTHAIGDSLRVSLIQGNVTQDQKWLPSNRIKTLQKYKRLTEEHWDSDVIIWPETAIPAYLSEVEESFVQPLNVEAKKRQTDLIVSVPVAGHANGERYNAVITLGKERGMYQKDHLLPFGEYLPLQPLSGLVLNSLNINLGNFKSGGANQPLLKAGDYPFITTICYEDAFGDIGVRGMPDAAYLVNVTNDAWFGDSIEPHQHMQIARMRALETGRYLLRATNTGVTAIVAPDGKIISQAPLFETTVVTDFIVPMAGITPYARLGGDEGVIIILLLGLFSLMLFNVLFSKKILIKECHGRK